MAYYCHACAAVQSHVTRGAVGRTATCDSCQADLHCCMNCSHYDPNAYNGCREPHAERVLEKDRSNFCDFFSYAGRSEAPAPSRSKKKTSLSKLDDLFK